MGFYHFPAQDASILIIPFARLALVGGTNVSTPRIASVDMFVLTGCGPQIKRTCANFRVQLSLGKPLSLAKVLAYKSLHECFMYQWLNLPCCIRWQVVKNKCKDVFASQDLTHELLILLKAFITTFAYLHAFLVPRDIRHDSSFSGRLAHRHPMLDRWRLRYYHHDQSS